MARPVIKRLLVTAALLLVLAAVAVVTLPWWLGAVARGPAARYGLSYGTYRAEGYGRWVLTDVRYANTGVVVEVDRFEAPHLFTWWRRRYEAGVVQAQGVRVTVEGRESDAPRESPGPWLTSYAPWLRLWATLRAEVPPIAADEVTVTWGEAAADQIRATRVEVDLTQRLYATNLDWRGTDLTVELARREADSVWELAVADAAGQALVSSELTGGDGQLHWQGRAWDQPFDLQTTLGAEQRWRPRQFQLNAELVALPMAQIGLGDYGETLRGRIDLGLDEDGRSHVVVGLTSDPGAEADLPEVAVALTAAGGLNEIAVDQFQVALPGVQLDLTDPMLISRERWREVQPSELALRADLAEQPWWPEAQGTVTGTLQVMPRSADWPEIEATLTVAHLVFAGQEVEEAEVVGQLTWPEWRLESVRAHDAAGSVVDAHGAGRFGPLEYDLEVRQLDLRRESLQRWLPAELDFAEATGKGRAVGRGGQLEVEAAVNADAVRVGALRPLALAVEVERHGEPTWHWAVEASPERTEARLRAQGSWAGETLTVEAAELQREDTVLLALPGALSWQTAEHRLPAVSLEGTLGHWDVALESAQAGRVTGQSSGFEFEWIRDWWADLPETLPHITRLDGQVSWTPVDLTFAAEIEAMMTLKTVGQVNAHAVVAADATELNLTRLEVGQGPRQFAAATGRVPVRWRRDADGAWQVDTEGPWALQINVSPHREFWSAWGALTGVTLTAPEMHLELGGTWAEPVGEGRVKLGRLEIAGDEADGNWPVITALEADVKLDGKGLRLQRLTARADEQAVEASGYLPGGRDDWAELRADPLAYVRAHAEAQLRLDDVNLAHSSRLLPQFLVPTGTVNVAVEYGDGGQVQGSARVRGLATRPLGALGALRDINAELSFAGRRMQLEEAEARLGGQALALDGAMEWPIDAPPRIDLHLQGNNMPLVRSTDVLLRGNLDLAVRTDRDGVTTISGRVGLRDGLMLADIRAFVPKGGADRPSRRPPYFSVEVEPLRDWRLDVRLTGEEFLRMRTPVLNGVASIDMRLDGTLFSPRAIGELTINEGVVKLPFANFDIEEAYARLEPGTPYEPDIFLRGEGRRLGYDLSLELSGTASDPRLEVGSDPALPASDVLLFVMAGVAPNQEDTDLKMEQRSLQLGMYLGRELFTDLLGLDPGDRLTVTTGEQLSRRGRETYRFDYELNDRWTVSGEYDEFDYYNAGLLWRWYPWKKDAPEAEGDTPSADAETEESRR